MKRWMYSAALATAALFGTLFWAHRERTPRAPEPQPPPDTHATPSLASGRSLELRARLDQGLLVEDIPSEPNLVITVHTAAIPDSTREPVDVAVVMDTSGSMSGKGKIEYARAAARRMAEMLEERDRFSLVTFSDRATTVWPSQALTERTRLFSLIEGLREGGGTNMYDGLQAGLQELRKESPNRVRRLLLLSDGYANIGISDSPSLSALVARETSRGVNSSTVGLGLDYNEDLLASMADAGGGSYRFIDDPSLLTNIFAQELSNATRTIAHNALLRVDLPDGVRLLEAYGYPSPSEPRTYEVYLGDVFAGQDRKIVLHLRVDDPDGPTMDLADIKLDFIDLLSDGAATAEARVSARVTHDPAEAERSQDKEAGILATRARAATVAEAAARAYQQNDRDTARSRLDEASRLIQEFARRFDAPELLKDDKVYQEAVEVYSMAPAESEAGQREVKRQKEVSRVNAR